MREQPTGDWIRSTSPAEGVEVMAAWFGGRAFAPHRHDTYAIGVTESGVQGFDYRGSARISLPGDIVILHPDELHDGRAEDDRGFGYAIVYVRPTLIAAAVEAIAGHPRPLPFVPDPVTRHPALATALRTAAREPSAPLLADALVSALAEALLRGDPASRVNPDGAVRLDARAVARAQDFLDAECDRTVRSEELESVSGLNRFALTRQFRAACGTSPHRYALMRRLERARNDLDDGAGSLAQIAAVAGFADQAHMTRSFKAAYGMTPGRYRALRNDRVVIPLGLVAEVA